VTSILELDRAKHQDAFVLKLLDDAKRARIVTASQIVEHCRPSGTLLSRDSLAMSQGLWTPPHLLLLAEVAALRSPRVACDTLPTIAQKAASHLERAERRKTRSERIGTNIFIGHARSLIWKDLTGC
jgi:hypothetical protein